MSKATTLRWLIDNKWGNPKSQPEAQTLIDEIVGFAAPGRVVNPASPAEAVEHSAPVPTLGKKVALIVGHNSVAQGADADEPLSRSEYELHCPVAAEAIDQLAKVGIEARRFLRTAAGGYVAEIDRVYEKVNEWAPDLCVEMHFNAGGGDYAVMLHADRSERGKKAAQAMLEVFAAALKVKANGLKACTLDTRGGRSVIKAKAPCVLTEPFFGDHPQHCATVAALGVEGYAAIYVAAVQAALKAIA